MKKLILWALALVTPAALYAQAPGGYAAKVSDYAVRLDGGSIVSGGGGVTGGTCTNQFVRALDTSGVPTCATVGSADIVGNPQFTLFQVGNGATSGGTFDILEDSDNGTNKITIGGQDSLSADVTYRFPASVGTAYSTTTGTIAVGNDAYPGQPGNPRTTLSCFDDFGGRSIDGGAGTYIPFGCGFYVFGSGTTSGQKFSAIPAQDGTVQGAIGISTGTTTTGIGGIYWGLANNGTSDGLTIDGGEIVEYRVYITAVSDGTNTTQAAVGFTDIGAGGGGNDRLYIYWDNNADTHWGCSANDGTGASDTLSTTVATAGAWHILRVQVNSGATSVAYYVDGAELSCSPKAVKIPTGSGHPVAAVFRLKASAGCALATTCTAAADYAYLYKPNINR